MPMSPSVVSTHMLAWPVGTMRWLRSLRAPPSRAQGETVTEVGTVKLDASMLRPRAHFTRQSYCIALRPECQAQEFRRGTHAYGLGSHTGDGPLLFRDHRAACTQSPTAQVPPSMSWYPGTVPWMAPCHVSAIPRSL